jgi:hypothetical protein
MAAAGVARWIAGFRPSAPVGGRGPAHVGEAPAAATGIGAEGSSNIQAISPSSAESRPGAPAGTPLLSRAWPTSAST